MDWTAVGSPLGLQTRGFHKVLQSYPSEPDQQMIENNQGEAKNGLLLRLPGEAEQQ